jgi:hypothetical protein
MGRSGDRRLGGRYRPIGCTNSAGARAEDERDVVEGYISIRWWFHYPDGVSTQHAAYRRLVSDYVGVIRLVYCGGPSHSQSQSAYEFHSKPHYGELRRVLAGPHCGLGQDFRRVATVPGNHHGHGILIVIVAKRCIGDNAAAATFLRRVPHPDPPPKHGLGRYRWIVGQVVERCHGVKP